MGKYLSDPTRDKASASYLNFANDIESQKNWFPFVVMLKETGCLIGTCSIVPSDDGKQWDFGYCIHKNYWRQGYASEVVKALVSFGKTRHIHEFTVDVANENIGSNKVLKKLGFNIVKKGTFKKSGTDIEYEMNTYMLTI